MAKRRLLFILPGVIVAAAIFMLFGGWWPWTSSSFSRPVIKLINPGDTFTQLAVGAGLATDTAMAIIERSKDIYDLASIRAGRELAFMFSAIDNRFQKLVYQVNTEQEFIVESVEKEGSPAEWQADLVAIPYEIKQKEIEAVIDASLYETFLVNNWDIRLGLALAEVFAWQIDFAADIQKGDNFKMIFEERYRDGIYVMPGKILAVSFSNAGKVFRGYYFSETDLAEGAPAESANQRSKAGYYDENGNSLQKVFLKSPLQYKYVSSGFSYGRYNPILKQVSPHRAIDYAANPGTPAVAVGDGTVIQAGWNGDYGISVTIRHNDTYKTVYGHFQSLAKGVKVGAKVEQGQVIGYVGSTGLTTGPHLHYEMHKFGAYVNPFYVEVPPGQPITDEDRAAFAAIVQKFKL